MSIADPHLLEPGTWETPILSLKSGYIRFIDTARLVAFAKSYHVKVHVVRRVGHFVPAGTTLFMVHRGIGSLGINVTNCCVPLTWARPEPCSRTSSSAFCRLSTSL